MKADLQHFHHFMFRDERELTKIPNYGHLLAPFSNEAQRLTHLERVARLSGELSTTSDNEYTSLEDTAYEP